jgi:hypothetical protein
MYKILGDKDGRYVEVTTLPPSQCRKSRISGALTYRIPKGLSGPAHGNNLYLYIPEYLLTHSLTPWSRGLPEKLIGPQLFWKFSTFHGTRRFITTFTKASHLSQSSAHPRILSNLKAGGTHTAIRTKLYGLV